MQLYLTYRTVISITFSQCCVRNRGKMRLRLCCLPCDAEGSRDAYSTCATIFPLEVMHGRSGPCHLSYRAVIHHNQRDQARRPRSMGAHGVRALGAGVVWSSRLLLLGLHRSLVPGCGGERACASAETFVVSVANILFEPPSPGRQEVRSNVLQ